MRMLNIRRFIILLLSFFCLLTIIISCLLYFFSANDYSKWISEQVKHATGYDIRFEMVESNWLTENQFSVLGLSLYQHDIPIVYIDRLDIQIENLDLWSRHLEVKNLYLSGVQLDIKAPIPSIDNQLLNNNESLKTQENTRSKSIEWEKLQITHFKITDMNANVQYLDQTLNVKGANFEINDVLIIEDNQLISMLKKIDISTRIEHVGYKDEKLSAQINNVNLSTQGNLLRREAELDLSIDDVKIVDGKNPAYVLNSLLMQFAFKDNRLSLKQLSMNAFSGALAAKAEAILSFDLLPEPAIKIASIQINSLIAQDMDMSLPNFIPFNQQVSEEVEGGLLPIENLLIEEMNLQNMSLHSEYEQWPMAIKSADFHVENFQAITDNKFWTIDYQTSQIGTFSITFSELSWQNSVIEQFSLSGSLSDSEQGLSSLQQLLH